MFFSLLILTTMKPCVTFYEDATRQAYNHDPYKRLALY